MDMQNVFTVCAKLSTYNNMVKHKLTALDHQRARLNKTLCAVYQAALVS